MYLTTQQPGLSERHLCLTEQETACPSGMTDDCPVRLVASSSSFDSFMTILLVIVQLSIKSIPFDYCLYHWSVRTIIYVQFHNICQNVWYLNPEAQSCSVVGELELELGTQTDNV